MKQAYRALHEARQRQQASEFRALYAKRAGVEGTIAQSVRTCEMRLVHELYKLLLKMSTTHRTVFSHGG